VTLLHLLTRFAIDLPGEPPDYVRPPSATTPRYIELLEGNTHLIYPALAVLVLVLIALGILQAWRSEDMDGVQKAELKRDVIRELRREVHGLSADALSKAVGVPSLKLLRVLEEMQKDNILESRTDTQRLTTWRMKL
jgi:hypothetical protein